MITLSSALPLHGETLFTSLLLSSSVKSQITELNKYIVWAKMLMNCNNKRKHADVNYYKESFKLLWWLNTINIIYVNLLKERNFGDG